jgi:hypothetical protein
LGLKTVFYVQEGYCGEKEKVAVAAGWCVMPVKTRIRRLIKWQIFPAIEMRYASLSFIKNIFAAGIVWRQR